MPPTEPAVRLAPNDARLGPWRAFLTAHARVSRRLDEELRLEHGLSLAEYEALLSIATAPERRIRMSLLAEQVLLSKSGVTRLVDRLVADDLVERRQCATDARGAEAALTATGLDRLRTAAVTHLRGIQDHFLEHVEPSDLTVLERALTAVAERAGPGTAADPEGCAPETVATDLAPPR